MSQRSKPPFRADQVGSLIRPDNVRQARKDFEAGKLSEEALRDIQREAIPAVVKLQEDLGFKWLNRAHRDRCFEMIALRFDPRFDVVRSDKRLETIARQMGLK